MKGWLGTGVTPRALGGFVSPESWGPSPCRSQAILRALVPPETLPLTPVPALLWETSPGPGAAWAWGGPSTGAEEPPAGCSLKPRGVFKSPHVHLSMCLGEAFLPVG